MLRLGLGRDRHEQTRVRAQVPQTQRLEMRGERRDVDGRKLAERTSVNALEAGRWTHCSSTPASTRILWRHCRFTAGNARRSMNATPSMRKNANAGQNQHGRSSRTRRTKDTAGEDERVGVDGLVVQLVHRECDDLDDGSAVLRLAIQIKLESTGRHEATARASVMLVKARPRTSLRCRRAIRDMLPGGPAGGF